MSFAAIKVNVSIGQPFVIAGNVFAVDTHIENLHSDEIEVVSLIYHIPYQMCWIYEQQYAEEYKRRKGSWFRSKFTTVSSCWKAAVSLPGMEMMYGNSNLAADGSQGTVMKILSGEAGSYSFKGVVPRWLFLTGGQLSFPGKIVYRFEGKEHSSIFKVELTLRPPLLANTIGAVVGSIIGCGAKRLKEDGGTFLQGLSLQFVATTALASILSTIAVIYSSRRTGDSQPILTVEDFWGGFLVGFTIGYVGNQTFQKFLPINEKSS